MEPRRHSPMVITSMNDPSKLIVYDVEELQKMDAEGLLLQLIGREDLRRPNRQMDIDTAAMKAKLVAAARGYLAEVAKLDQPTLTRQLTEITAAYFAEES